MALPPILVELKANSSEFVAGMRGAQAEVQKLGNEGSGHMAKFAAVGKAALFGVGAVALTVGGLSVEMADRFEVAHAKITAALKGAGTSMDTWKGQISAADGRMEKLGFTNAQSEDALGRLVIALHDPAKALQVLGTAADLARAKNIDLSAAGVSVAKAMEGNSRALKQMGIDLPINTKSAEGLKVAQQNLKTATENYRAQLDTVHAKHTVTHADEERLRTAHEKLQFAQGQVNEAQHAGTLVLDELNKRLGGQSQAYTETFAGKVTVLKTKLEDLGVKIGLAVIPILETLAGATEKVVNWFERHKTIAEVLGIVVGTALVAAVAAYTVAMITAAGATIAATWPILAIIAACAAVAIGIAELATHWHQVWGAIRDFMSSVGHEIIHILETWGPLALAVLVPFLGIPLLIAQHFNTIKGFIAAAWNGIKSVFDDIVHLGVDVLETAIRGLVRLWGDTWHAMASAFGDFGGFVIGGVLKPLVNAFLDFVGTFVDGAAKAFGWVPLVGGKLKGAAREFDSFRSGVTNSMQGLADSMYGIGDSMAAGLASGISQNQRKAIVAAANMGALTAQAAKNAVRSSSPSKVMIDLGQDMATGLSIGINAGTPDAVSSAEKMMNAVEKQFKTKLDGIVSQIASVKSTAAQMRDSIASSLSGAASLGSQPGTTDATGASVGPDTSVGGVTSYLTSSLAALRQFQGDLSTLAKKGLSADQIQQIAQMGVTKGDQYAQSFLGANAAQIRQLNSLDASIGKVTTGIGTLVSNDTFGTQISALTKQEAQAAASMKVVEKAIAELVAEAKKKKPAELHVHIDGNLYGVDSKQFIKEVKDGLLAYRRSSGQSLGFS